MRRLFVYAIGLLSYLLAEGLAVAAPADKPIILFAFGDSLTSGYGLPQGDSFPVKLQTALRARGLNVEVVNGGVAGDTSANGLDRLDWSLPDQADAAIVEFGANDAFQGVPVVKLKANMDRIVQILKSKGLEVMISGMYAPRNMGVDYTKEFDQVFPDIAAKYDCVLYPFYLEGVITDPKFNQADHIHPNAAGVDVIVARIVPTVEQLVARVTKTRAEHGNHSAN